MANYNIFIYGEAEISYLKKRDKRFAEVIDKVGPIAVSYTHLTLPTNSRV